MGALLQLAVRAPSVALTKRQTKRRERGDEDNDGATCEALRVLYAPDEAAMMHAYVARAVGAACRISVVVKGRQAFEAPHFGHAGRRWELRPPFMGGTYYTRRGVAVPHVVLAQVCVVALLRFAGELETTCRSRVRLGRPY